ncbi:hypothetical protein RZN05_18780 [Sphingomonas sp. HF-S4]|uniref:DUF6894 domain-containing protein n=1 Tax=Sphingomonas agrestis TaxID=3080540 RepID=A0ABU3YCD6_9SPHN|nr:hypothetical protein [Sphingomonas sp. HF-S4]MDV3459051.1 hypothetical protein [Sphingomonas sp. HF-S4]
MPQFFFQLRTQGTAPRFDDSPRDLPSLAAALAEGQGRARALLHNHLRRAPGPVHGTLEIEDDRHRPVARILLADIARQIS